MKGMLTKTDGSLRIGLISLVIFGLLLIIPGIVMQLGSSAEQVMVKVKHKFVAAPKKVSAKPAVEPVRRIPIKKEQQIAKTASTADATVKKTALQPNPTVTQKSPQQMTAVAVAKVPRETPKKISVQKKIQSPQTKVQAQKKSEKIVEVTLSEAPPVVVKPVAPQAPAIKLTSLASLSGVTGETTPSVRVDKKEYRRLFKAWQSAGGEKVEGEKPALRVENLRQTFDSFNMKPVALKGTNAFDLQDGTRLPEGLLKNYAATVFEVKNPWQDWGAGLKKLGLKQGSSIEVRYYMYDFIHNAIYARSQQAIVWAKAQGLLAADAQGVEVRGRAYQIKQQGGGRFGVFVPQQILTVSGKQIKVAPSAFAGQPDIEQLQQSGLL
ncbi:MAG: hypothetical protein L3J63_10655 [Geopsychrobacter sp.]|nr:hypothetical protein [Geopsychrobacter sp.]